MRYEKEKFFHRTINKINYLLIYSYNVTYIYILLIKLNIKHN